MADAITLSIVALGLIVVGLLVAIVVLLLRRPAATIPVEVAERLALLQSLPALKENADQNLPIIRKLTTDLGEWVLQSHKVSAAQDRVVGESLARLQEITKKTPELAERVAVVQNELKRLQHVEQGVQDLTKLFLSTQGRGQMGEEAVRTQFQALPNDMWSEQYALGGGKVDFAIHMPNKRVLPIDSKTSGLQPIMEYYNLGERIAKAEGGEKEALLAQQGKVQTRIRQAILSKTYEVAAYIQPQNGTLGIAIQAVPDSLYSILDVKTRKEASEQSVQIVPYGLLIPVAHMLRSQNQYDRVDLQSAISAMQGIRLQTNVIRDVLVNKFEKAHKFLGSGLTDVKDALDAIDHNSNALADGGPDNSGTATLRTRMRQKGILEIE